MLPSLTLLLARPSHLRCHSPPLSLLSCPPPLRSSSYRPPRRSFSSLLSFPPLFPSTPSHLLLPPTTTQLQRRKLRRLWRRVLDVVSGHLKRLPRRDGPDPLYAHTHRLRRTRNRRGASRSSRFETKVCIRRENSCTQDMPHASIPARGARGSDGGGRGAKKEN